MTKRTATVERKTRETSVRLKLNLDGESKTTISTGVGMLDHLINSLAFHAGFDCTLECQGDLQVDDHHTVEDCALVLGEALNSALGERNSITRFGSEFAPLDESLSRAVVDLSGRPHATVNLQLTRDRLGELACENITHFLHSLAMAARLTLHVDVLRGENDHHKAEAAFKATALALRTAITSGKGPLPSTKGTLGGNES